MYKQKQYKTTTTGMRKVYVDFTGRHHQYFTVQGKSHWSCKYSKSNTKWIDWKPYVNLQLASGREGK